MAWQVSKLKILCFFIFGCVCRICFQLFYRLITPIGTVFTVRIHSRLYLLFWLVVAQFRCFAAFGFLTQYLRLDFYVFRTQNILNNKLNINFVQQIMHIKISLFIYYLWLYFHKKNWCCSWIGVYGKMVFVVYSLLHQYQWIRWVHLKVERG